MRVSLPQKWWCWWRQNGILADICINSYGLFTPFQTLELYTFLIKHFFACEQATLLCIYRNKALIECVYPNGKLWNFFFLSIPSKQTKLIHLGGRLRDIINHISNKTISCIQVNGNILPMALLAMRKDECTMATMNKKRKQKKIHTHNNSGTSNWHVTVRTGFSNFFFHSR